MFFSGHRGRHSLTQNEYDQGYDSLNESEESDQDELEAEASDVETPSATSEDENLYDHIREMTDRRLSLLTKFGSGAHGLTEGVGGNDSPEVCTNFTEIDNMMDTISVSNDRLVKTSIENQKKEIEKELRSYGRRNWTQRHRASSYISDIKSRQQDRLKNLLDDIHQKEEEKRRQEEARKRAQEEARLREIAQRRAEEERLETERERLEKERHERERLVKEKAERDRLAEEKARAERLAKQTADQERQAQQKAERDRLAKQEEAKRAASADHVFTDFKEVEREFFAYKQKIHEIKETIVTPVSLDKELKTYTFNAKRQIKPKLGQLTESKQHLHSLATEVEAVLNTAKSQHELAYLWLLNFLAKSIVSQSETETIVSLQSAIPLGMFTINCLVKHPALKEFLLARFVKKCPQCIGYSCSIDTEEGRRRMGWKRRNEKWEDDAQYSERISGMICVWAVITQSKLGAQSAHEHPYPFSNTWKFLARQLNKDPKLLQNSDYAAVAGWWDISAKRFLDVYGRQGAKLLKLVWDEWTALSSAKRYPAAARLRLLGEDWRDKKVITVRWKQMSA